MRGRQQQQQQQQQPIHAQNGVLPDMFTSVNHIDFGKQDTAQKFNMKV